MEKISYKSLPKPMVSPGLNIKETPQCAYKKQVRVSAIAKIVFGLLLIPTLLGAGFGLILIVDGISHLHHREVEHLNQQPKQAETTKIEYETIMGKVFYHKTFERENFVKLTVDQIEQAIEDTSIAFGKKVRACSQKLTRDGKAYFAPVSTTLDGEKYNAVALYSQSNELGSGGYGDVYSGALIEKDPNGNFHMHDVALKVGQDPDILQASEEVHGLRKEASQFLESKSLGFGFATTEGHEILVKELCLLGDVDQFEFKNVQGIVKMLLGVGIGLNVLKMQGFAHRDIKPENIFMLPNGFGQVMDFDTTSYETEKIDDVCGTPGYFDPDEASHGQDSTGDIYAFREVASDILDLYIEKTADEPKKLLAEEADALISLQRMIDMLNVPHDQRPTAADVVGMLQGIVGTETLQELKEQDLMSAF